MTARTPKVPKSEQARKKLRLSKETLKDLTEARGSVKGGGLPHPTLTCRDSCQVTCGPGPQ
jgi:hypothetical protein